MDNYFYLLQVLDEIKELEAKISENRQKLCDVFYYAHYKLRKELPEDIKNSGVLDYVYKLTGMNPIRFSRFSKHIGDMNPTKEEILTAQMLLRLPVTEYEKQIWPGKEKSMYK